MSGPIVALAALSVGVALGQEPATPTAELSFGTGVVVPTEANWTLVYTSLGVGTSIGEHGTLGLRGGVTPGGVPAELSASGGVGWAALLDGRAYLRRSTRLDPFVLASVGFAAAVPRAPDQDNLVAPVVQLGAGLEYLVALPSGGQLFLAPQIGVLPGVFYGGSPLSVVAPTADLRVGVRRGWP